MTLIKKNKLHTIPIQHMYVIGRDFEDPSENVTVVKKLGWYRGHDPRLINGHLYHIVVRREAFINKKTGEEKICYLYVAEYDYTNRVPNGTILEYDVTAKPYTQKERETDWDFFQEGMVFDHSSLAKEIGAII